MRAFTEALIIGLVVIGELTCVAAFLAFVMLVSP